MKKYVVLAAIAFLSIAVAKPKKGEPVREWLRADPKDETLLLIKDCPFLVKLTPKDKLAQPLGFCIYTHTEERGIFVYSACVGALAEPDTQTKNAFYGSRGHWGVEGHCSKELLEKKLAEKEIDTTVNPITDIRQKRKNGMKIKKLRDEFGIWDAFEKRTRP